MRLWLPSLLAHCFSSGLAVGWLGFEQMVVAAVLPLAAVFVVMALIPAIDDLMAAKR